GEKVVGAQAGNGIAGQKKHESLAEPDHARGAGGAHGDAVNAQLAVWDKQSGSIVFLTDAGAAGDEDDVGVGLHGGQDGGGVVWNNVRTQRSEVRGRQPDTRSELGSLAHY